MKVCYGAQPRLAEESRKRLMDIAAGNLRAFVDGKPVNVVNQ